VIKLEGNLCQAIIFKTIRGSIINESKRVLKQVSKSKLVKNEVRDNLLNLFNQFTEIVAFYYFSLNEQQRLEVKKLFTTLRDRVVRSYQVLRVDFKIPSSCVEAINLEIKGEEIEDDQQTNIEDTKDLEETKVKNMEMTKIDIFNFANKVLPNAFDGSPDKLQSVIDALTLLKSNAAGHEEDAVAYVKTRLIGKARDLITDDTLDVITTKLKTGIKTDSSQLVTAKLLSLKQKNKDAAGYAVEVEALSSSLKRAFISEGVPVGTAESYATNTTVETLSKNSNSERVKLVMEAGTFNNSQDAITKFVNVAQESSTATVLYTNNRGTYGRRGNKNSFRGKNPNYTFHYNLNRERNYRHNNYHQSNHQANYHDKPLFPFSRRKWK
ncbi:unnamed protein product, partial [Brassicogethes aeneus]